MAGGCSTDRGCRAGGCSTDRGCRAGGWSAHNHNNNNHSHPRSCELANNGGKQGPGNNTPNIMHNGMPGCQPSPPAGTCRTAYNVDKHESYYSNVGSSLQLPGSAPYAQTPFDGQQVPPHSAPAPSCSLTFRYPQVSETTLAQELYTGDGSPASAHCYSGIWGGSRAFTTNVHAPSTNSSSNGPVGANNRNHSEDSEEDDYYDNENLLICSPTETRCNNLYIGSDTVYTGTQQIHRTVTSQANDYGYQQRKHNVDIYLETDRLRSQLQEAYYLLIHAMHDMPLENHLDRVVSKVERCPSSSQDSVYSQSSARAIESDVWSSDEASPKQVSHCDLVSLNALTSTEINRIQIYSKSLDAICTIPEEMILQRSCSDGVIKYSPFNSQASSDCGLESHQGDGHMDSEGDSSPQTILQAVNWGASEGSNESQTVYSLEEPSDSGVMNCRNDTTVPSGDQGGSQKPPGLTVKKMQKWMYKGRLLSLEMKERIIGSSQRAGGSCRTASGRTCSSRPETPQTSSAASMKLPGENQRPPMTGRRAGHGPSSRPAYVNLIFSSWAVGKHRSPITFQSICTNG
ncbi:uncharacterized protein O3C94_015708 [Discoglossus pictus]